VKSLSDKQLPISDTSSRVNDLIKLELDPPIETKLPMRKQFLTETQLPTCSRSNVERSYSCAHFPKVSDMLCPSLFQFLQLTAEVICNESDKLNALSIAELENIDNLDPIHLYCRMLIPEEK
jgi:hypothetical protein